MNVLDLFSGVGGFSLGLERAGMQTVAFCETNKYCQRVLAQHWPRIPIYGDVRELSGERLAADRISVDVIAAGFPCQEISNAGNGEGLRGARSGLWSECARIVGEVRPRFVLLENVAALLDRGLGEILGELAALGYDAEWNCLPASSIGAPHRRDRLWLLAYAKVNNQRSRPDEEQAQDNGRRNGLGDSGCHVAHASAPGPQIGTRLETEHEARRLDADRGSNRERAPLLGAGWFAARRAMAERGNWNAEPAVGRVAHGIPARVDRIKGLGNAVVPQVVEIIGRAILLSVKQFEK